MRIAAIVGASGKLLRRWPRFLSPEIINAAHKREPNLARGLHCQRQAGSLIPIELSKNHNEIIVSTSHYTN
jgi:hypothetical protein